MTRRHTHPSVLMLLIAPFGTLSGYLTVALAYTLAHAGLSVERIAGLVALSYVPHTWKFLWAPIADTTLTRKTWYLIGIVVTVVTLAWTGWVPAEQAHLGQISVLILVSNFAVTLVGMSTESLMAHGATAEEQGRAGGWFQAGNLGGQGIGGGIGLMLAQKLPAAWMASSALAIGCLVCAIGLFWIPEPVSTIRGTGIGASLVNVAKDIWSVARSRRGFLALVLCFLPIGSGAASNLWAAVSKDWSATAGTVALVTGVLGGIVMALGCLVGGFICDRMDRKKAYMLFGIMQAACAAGMALAPHTQTNYIVFTLIYALVTGFTYAGFTAFVLEAMGLGAAATKYNLYASLSNFPIMYMTNVDGWAHGRYGPSGMLYTEAAICMLGLVAFTLVLARWPHERTAAVVVEGTPAV
jgi:MFS transporter, PAT family, beta-lactamase induction signal transducer AmpG